MPRRKIQFVAGEYYHVFNRGAVRQSLFLDERDYEYFLRRLKRYSKIFNVTVIVYCLMRNHYHLLLHQNDLPSIETLMQRLGNSYSKYFNNRYQKTGAVFEDRFKALHVGRDDYLHHLCRYIHGNPVKDGLAARPDLWPYSNYLEWIGKRSGELVDRAFIEARFSSIARYQQYIAAYLAQELNLPDGIKSLNAYLHELEM